MTDILDKLPIPDGTKAELRSQAKAAAEASPLPSEQVYERELERLALTWYMKNNQPTVKQIKRGGFRHTKTLPSRLWKSGRRR